MTQSGSPDMVQRSVSQQPLWALSHFSGSHLRSLSLAALLTGEHQWKVRKCASLERPSHAPPKLTHAASCMLESCMSPPACVPASPLSPKQIGCSGRNFNTA